MTSSDETLRSTQDDLIEEVNRPLDADEWYATSELAYDHWLPWVH